MTHEEYLTLYRTRANNRCDGHQNQHYGFWMQQDPVEFWDLINAINPINPKIIVEIGVNHGGSTVFWDHLVGPDGLVIAIDRCGHQGDIMSMFRPEFCDYVPVSDLRLIDGDSHDEETFEKVKTSLASRPIDFLFIDGDHAYEGCKMDYEMYGPLVRKGGIIGFDDVVSPSLKPYWNELPEPKKLFAVRQHGLGVVYVGENQ